MQKAMVFVDFENFNISKREYYKTIKDKGTKLPSIDFLKFSKEIIKKLPNQHALVKTFIFAPKPDDFLMQDVRRKRTYDFISGMKNLDYLTVIEGLHIARPIGDSPYLTMDINNTETFFVKEKGTDVNLGVHLLTKGFLNAYDTAIIVSGDTDYIPIMDTLNTFGKTVCVVGVKGRSLNKFKQHSDQQITLDDTFFQRCLSEKKIKGQTKMSI